MNAFPSSAFSGAPAAAPFTVMAKPVGRRCNLACGYCYYKSGIHSPGFAVPADAHPACMPNSLLEEFIRQYMQASPDKTVYFTWHGGEPALAGMDFYKRALELQNKHIGTGRSFVNNLQTNGTLLGD